MRWRIDTFSLGAMTAGAVALIQFGAQPDIRLDRLTWQRQKLLHATLFSQPAHQIDQV